MLHTPTPTELGMAVFFFVKRIVYKKGIEEFDHRDQVLGARLGEGLVFGIHVVFDGHAARFQLGIIGVTFIIGHCESDQIIRDGVTVFPAIGLVGTFFNFGYQ